jgi:cell division protein FtsA
VLLGVTCGRISSESFQASVAVQSTGVRADDIDRVLAAGRDYATREGRTLLHALATGCHLDGGTKISDPCGMMADRLQVDIHSVAADEAPLRNLMLCVERCHLEVAGLAAAPYASAIATLTPDEAKLGATCIDIGAGTTTIAVFADGEFILADALAMGGHLITLDLAHAFSTPLEDAERIKTLFASAYPTPSDEREMVALPMVGDHDLPQHNSTTKAQIAEIIRPRMEEIFIQVRDRLMAKGLGGSGSPRVVLTGGASQLPGLGDLAANILDAEIRLGRPRGVAGLPGTADPAFAAAVGLLLFSDRFAAEAAIRIEEPTLATGTGYLARVGEWIKESF